MKSILAEDWDPVVEAVLCAYEIWFLYSGLNVFVFCFQRKLLSLLSVDGAY